MPAARAMWLRSVVEIRDQAVKSHTPDPQGDAARLAEAKRKAGQA